MGLAPLVSLKAPVVLEFAPGTRCASEADSFFHHLFTMGDGDWDNYSNTT